METAKRMLIVLLALGGLFAGNCFAAREDIGTISGKVVDGQTGVPLSTARIELFSESEQKIVASTATEADGTFEFLQVPYGKYSFEKS